MSLKSIKNKIRSVDKTNKVTKAMEAVSAVKMRKSQERALDGRAYARSALTILSRISGSFDGRNHPLSVKRDEKNICIIVVTSDKGLAGNLNNAVLKNTVKLIKEHNYSKERLQFICMGNKGFEFFSKRGYNVVKNLVNISDEVSSDDMKEITEKLISDYTEEKYDKCYVVYTNFISTFEQQAVTRRLLPLSVPAITEIVDGIRPSHGKFTERTGGGVKNIKEYTVEPNAEEVLNELLPFLLNIEVYHTLLEAKASEHSARMVAMKNASDKASEISKELNLKFNKERQSLITREVSEIIGGIEVMAN